MLVTVHSSHDLTCCARATVSASLKPPPNQTRSDLLRLLQSFMGRRECLATRRGSALDSDLNQSFFDFIDGLKPAQSWENTER